jgi:uncharacterized membrane protein YraQ (UPF0718 family)
MGIAALGLCALALQQGGWERLALGLLLGGKTLIQVIPLMVLAFATAGLISTLISNELVSRWLGREAGLKGLFLGALAGAIIPAGPFVYYPLAAAFLVSGADIGAVIAFVTAKNLWTISRLPMEVALIGPKITFVRYIVTFAFPILVGALANALFSGYTEKIRSRTRELQKSGAAPRKRG